MMMVMVMIFTGVIGVKHESVRRREGHSYKKLGIDQKEYNETEKWGFIMVRLLCITI